MMRRILIIVFPVFLLISQFTSSVLAGTSIPVTTREAPIQFGKTELLYELPDRYIFKVDINTPYSQPSEVFFTYFYEIEFKYHELIEVDPTSTDQLVFSISTVDLFVYPYIPIFVQWSVTDNLGNYAISPLETIIGQDPRFEWNELSSQPFDISIYYHDRGDLFGQEILSITNQAAEKMEKYFQVHLSKPIILVIYNEISEVIGYSDMFDEYTPGRANPRLGIIFQVFPGPANTTEWAQTGISHEFSHLYFHQATGGNNASIIFSPPSWLNEGLAEVNSLGIDEDTINKALQDLHQAEKVPTLRVLQYKFYIRDDTTFLAYSQAYSVVCYLISTYGEESIAEILTEYRNGARTEEAFINVLGFDFVELERQWREALGLPLDAMNNIRPTPIAITILPTPTATPVVRTETIVGAASGFAVLGLCCFILIILLVTVLILVTQRRKKRVHDRA